MRINTNHGGHQTHEDKNKPHNLAPCEKVRVPGGLEPANPGRTQTVGVGLCGRKAQCRRVLGGFACSGEKGPDVRPSRLRRVVVSDVPQIRWISGQINNLSCGHNGNKAHISKVVISDKV